MGDKKLAIFTGQVTVDGIKDAKIDELWHALSTSASAITINLWSVSKMPNGQHRVTFLVTYGPVKGAWRSDVTQIVKRALRTVGSHASIDVSALPGRKVLE